MKELRTDELKPGMVVKLKSRAGTLPQNQWFTVEAVEALPRKQFAPLGSTDSSFTNRRPFAARTLWLVQEDNKRADLTPGERIVREQRVLFDEMVRKGHARYVTTPKAQAA